MVGIQFSRPQKNISSPGVTAADFGRLPAPPADVQHTLQAACYDCHSNHTRYPWYAEVQPMGWWLAAHVKDGKRELNFNEIGTYSPARQAKKLKAILQEVAEQEMPLQSYTWAHRDAKLTATQLAGLRSWLAQAQASLTAVTTVAN